MYIIESSNPQNNIVKTKIFPLSLYKMVAVLSVGVHEFPLFSRLHELTNSSFDDKPQVRN